MASSLIPIQVPPGPVAKPRNRVVDNIAPILTKEKLALKGKQKTLVAENSRDLFLRVMESPPGLCVARITAPMGTCKAI